MQCRTQMFQQEEQCGGKKRTALSKCCGRKLENTLWLCFYSMVLGPIQTVVIEECIKILTKAQWSSTFSISGHVSSSFPINPII